MSSEVIATAVVVTEEQREQAELKHLRLRIRKNVQSREQAELEEKLRKLQQAEEQRAEATAKVRQRYFPFAAGMAAGLMALFAFCATGDWGLTLAPIVGGLLLMKLQG